MTAARELSDAECDAIYKSIFCDDHRTYPSEKILIRTAYAAGRAAGIADAAKVCDGEEQGYDIADEGDLGIACANCAAAIRALDVPQK